MAAVIFAWCVGILTIGFVWFWIVRPILEDYGIIRVNNYEDDTPVVMSRSEDNDSPSTASSLQTDSRQTVKHDQSSAPTPEQYLTLFRALRAAGIQREDIRPALKAVGLRLDNNLWTKAAPITQDTDDAEYRTPIVGRPTSAKFETDADYPYQSPA